MSGMTHTDYPTNPLNRPMKWAWLCGVLSLLLVPAVFGTDALYENDAVLDYTVPGNPPPAIDATNFVNNNTFSVVLDSLNPVKFITVDYYEPKNVRNYTNNGFMSVSTDDPLFFLPAQQLYEGIIPTFQFDTLTTNQILHQMAASFYNSDSCEIDIGGGGQLIVWATNITSRGTISGGGLIQLTGQNVDLTYSTLTLGEGGISGNVNASGLDWGSGTDTNGEWVPSYDLTPTTAQSSLYRTQYSPNWVNRMFLTDTTPYFNIENVDTNQIIVRAVFLLNPSPNVTDNVYFSGNTAPVGGGFDTIEWLGMYVDSASGLTMTNYLYLNDATGIYTNEPPINGVPDNFTFTGSTTPIFIGTPAASGFLNGIYQPVGEAETNFYSYVDAQLISTTVATNAGPSNPSGALTNLPMRIQINASRELNLNDYAEISGANYLSLTSTNQFDGNAGAQISSPYADISLGVTNGFLTVSNLLESPFPNWNGTVQAWSGRWLAFSTNDVITTDPISGVSTTNFYTVTNDFRVLIVNSQIAPTTSSQVQDFILHGTNIVISDALNILRTLSIDAQNLTLTTNGVGNGAASPDGELNVENSGILWPSSLPNLLNLTNNGAIRLGNLAVFGGPPPNNYQTFINNGLLSDQGSTIYASDFENSGAISNGAGSFILQSLTTALTNGPIIAGGDVSITADSLVTSDLVLQAGKSLTLQATNLLTDTGVIGNVWTVGGASSVGLNLPIKPASGDLLDTVITCTAPGQNKQVVNTWAGTNDGPVTAGYMNNAAVGKLVLNALGANSSFKFNGTGASNALYVGNLELDGALTNGIPQGYEFAPWLSINTNLVIYYGDAIMLGTSVADKIDEASQSGKNGGRLRWVSGYTGTFNSTNIVYPNGRIYAFNTALAQSTTLDSNGNGILNAIDSLPFFEPYQVNFTEKLTNNPLPTMLLTWCSIPSATNTVLYSTNVGGPYMLVLTNFVSSSLVPPTGGWPITNTVADPIGTNHLRTYRVLVYPNSTCVYGPGF